MTGEVNNQQNSNGPARMWNPLGKFPAAKKAVVISILGVALIAAVMVGLLYQRTYTSELYLYPQFGTPLQCIRSEHGGESLEIDFTRSGIPPEAYEVLLRSPQIQMQMQVLKNRYAIMLPYKNYQMDLMQYFARDQVAYALKDLNDITEIENLAGSQALKISVTTRYPGLSGQIAEAYVNALQEYLRQSAQEQSSAAADRLDSAIEGVQADTTISEEIKSEVISSLQLRRGMLLAERLIGSPDMAPSCQSVQRINNPMVPLQAAGIPIVTGLLLAALVLALPGPELKRGSVRRCRPVRPIKFDRGPETGSPEISQAVVQGRLEPKGSRLKRIVEV